MVEPDDAKRAEALKASGAQKAFATLEEALEERE